MPPKSKKEQEEEARRLEEEERRREEEAKLQAERIKYAPERLSTGTILPLTALLLSQYPQQPVAMIDGRVREAITMQKPDYPHVDFVLKEFHYFVQQVRLCFKTDQTDSSQTQKGRVLLGIMLAVLLNNEHIGSNGNSAADEALARELVLAHSSNQPPQRLAIFDREDVVKVLLALKRQNFSHSELIRKFKRFPSRKTSNQFSIYIEAPAVFANSKETPFTDLADKNGGQK